MGYTTEFKGRFTLNKKLSDKMYDFLIDFANSRRMARNRGSEFGVQGEFYVEGGQDSTTPDVIRDEPPSTQPGLWCQWVPTDNKCHIEWDGNEKFYEYIDWLQYIIVKFLAPNGYVLNGRVQWQGEEMDDRGTMTVVNNTLTISGGGEISAMNDPVLVLYEETMKAGAFRDVTSFAPLKRQRVLSATPAKPKGTIIKPRKINMG